MNSKEQSFLMIVLILIMALVLTDVLTDFQDGANVGHLVLEGLLGLFAAYAFFILIKNRFTNKHELQRQSDSIMQLIAEANTWKTNSQKYIQGLSRAIDLQLTKWNLTEAEKEVALLLLKGLSIKEIAQIRKTSEKTTRVQSTMIYQKSGLRGRSELAAFFLEDLLSPQDLMEQSPHLESAEAAMPNNPL